MTGNIGAINDKLRKEVLEKNPGCKMASQSDLSRVAHKDLLVYSEQIDSEMVIIDNQIQFKDSTYYMLIASEEIGLTTGASCERFGVVVDIDDDHIYSFMMSPEGSLSYQPEQSEEHRRIYGPVGLIRRKIIASGEFDTGKTLRFVVENEFEVLDGYEYSPSNFGSIISAELYGYMHTYCRIDDRLFMVDNDAAMIDLKLCKLLLFEKLQRE
jgi:hypothetical protein